MSIIWKAIVILALAAPVACRLCLGGQAADGGKTVVRYMAWGYPSQLKTERELIRQFESLPENSDVRVEFIMAPMRSYYDKLQLMLVSGTGPDVVRVNPDHFRAYVKRGFFHELDGFIEADATHNPEDFFDAARQGMEYEGRRYGVGVLFTTTLVYYNKTLFRAAGVKDPWERYQEGRWTWDDYLDTARALTVYGEGGRAAQFGSGPLGSIYNTANIVVGNGGRLTSADGGRSLVNSPEAVAAIEWIDGVSRRWKAAPTPEQGALAVFSFESGRIAMELDSSGESPRLREAISRFEWDVAPCPAGPSGVSAGYSAHILTMNAQTRAADAAWRFMAYMTSPVAERLLGVRLRRCIPTRRELALSEEYLRADEPPYNMRAFIARVDEPQPGWLYDEKWGEWSIEWRNHLERIYLAGRPARETMDEAATRIDMLLSGWAD